MSRSYKHTYITGNGSGSEKYDKRVANRCLRRTVKNAVFNGEEDIFPEMKEISNVWSFKKDGKHYFGNLQEFLRWHNGMQHQFYRTRRDEAFWTKVWRDLVGK